MFVWIALVASALLGGACFVGVLALKRSAEPIAALVGIVAFGVSAYSVTLLTTAYERLDVVVYALAFALAATAGGWGIGATMLERPPRLPEPQVDEAANDAVDGRPAVIVCACIEAPSYSISSTAGIMNSLAQEGLLEPSLVTLPFLFFAQKARYRALGGTSPSLAQLGDVADSLDGALGGLGLPSTRIATCADSSRLASVVAEEVGRGCEHVVIIPLTVGEGLHMAHAKREVDAMRLEERGVRVSHLDVLQSTERIVALIVSRVMASVSEPEETGMVLVGHGQPEARAKVNPSFDEQENALLYRVRMHLIDRGLAETHVRVGWAEWVEPDVTTCVRHLVATGCTRVLVVPAVYPLDNIATLLDFDIAIRQARVNDTAAVVSLPAWRNDPLLIDELAERVQTALTS